MGWEPEELVGLISWALMEPNGTLRANELS